MQKFGLSGNTKGKTRVFPLKQNSEIKPCQSRLKGGNIENCLASGNLMARLQEEKNYMDFGPKMCSWARKRRKARVCRQSNSKRHPRKGQA